MTSLGRHIRVAMFSQRVTTRAHAVKSKIITTFAIAKDRAPAGVGFAHREPYWYVAPVTPVIPVTFGLVAPVAPAGAAVADPGVEAAGVLEPWKRL